MPIEMPAMPAAVAAALAKGLPKFAVAASPPSEKVAAALVPRPSIARSSRTIARSIEAALAEGAAAGVGAPVFVMGLDDLSQSKSPRQQKARLWAQLLPQGADGAHAMAEVDQRAGKLTAVSEGAEVRSLARRIGGLASEKGSRSAARQELSIIRVPALHLTALWLKGESAADDVVIPNDGPIAPLVPGKRYSLAQFQEVAKAMAVERIAKTGEEMGG